MIITIFLVEKRGVISNFFMSDLQLLNKKYPNKSQFTTTIFI